MIPLIFFKGPTSFLEGPTSLLRTYNVVGKQVEGNVWVMTGTEFEDNSRNSIARDVPDPVPWLVHNCTDSITIEPQIAI